MGTFCKYCGKELDGGECNCEGAVKEREATSSENNSSSTLDTGNTTNTKNKGSGINIDISKVTENIDTVALMTLVKNFFKSPLNALKSAFNEKNKTVQFTIGGGSLLIIFIMSFLLFNIPYVETGFKFKMAFYAILGFSVTKTVYAFGVSIFAKKKSEAHYVSILAMFSVTLLFDALMTVIQTLLVRLSLNLLSSASLAFWGAGTLILSLIGAYVVYEEDFEKTYKITLLLQLIMAILVMFVISTIAKGMLSSLISSFSPMGSLSQYGF